VTLHRLEGFSAESNAVIDVNIIADYRSLANHNTHAVIYEESSPDGGSRVNLNTGPEAGDV
jgi:hypothetical protein